MVRTPDELKEIVRRGYTEALQASVAGSRSGQSSTATVTPVGSEASPVGRESASPQPSSTGCCGSASADTVPTASRTSPKQEYLTGGLGYSSADLDDLPADAVNAAFGCGNPIAFTEVREGDIILDIGSGAGIDCLIAARKTGPTGRVIGLDMTPAMIEKARENVVRAGVSNVEFRLGDAEAMPLDDASVDWVISNCVINLAPDKAKVFGEIARVLKPGGRVSIADIVIGDDLPREIAENMDAMVGCVAGAIKESDYIEGMRATGLTDVAVVERMGYNLGLVDAARAGDCGDGADAGCGCGTESVELYEKYRDQLSGAIWSARITARKA